MIRKQLENRRLSYEQKLLTMKVEQIDLQAQLKHVEATISELGGALYEVSNVIRDLNTQAAIDAAKAAQPVEEVSLKEEVPQNA